MEHNPDIILLNSHGLRDIEHLKVPGYTIHKINTSQEANDGSAIGVKHNIPFKLKDDYLTDVLSIQINTTLGPLNLATTYLPPRRPYLYLIQTYTHS